MAARTATINPTFGKRLQMSAEYNVTMTVNKKTGALTAMYFQVRAGKAAKTKEYANGVVLADYNARGKLIGVEMLGPSLTPCGVRNLIGLLFSSNSLEM